MKLARLVQTLDAILERGLRERRPTQEIAIDIAQARIDAARVRERVLEYS